MISLENGSARLDPSASRRLMETRGESLRRGFKNDLDDQPKHGGMPSPADQSPFKFGECLAETPGTAIPMAG